MSKLAFNGDGGKTDEYGTLLVQQRVLSGEVAEGCLVAANSSPNMGVRVQAGSLRIPTGTAPANYWYEAAIDTASPGEALTVSTANPANPRRDYVVAYIDKGVSRVTSVVNNSNAVLKLAVVAGTAASSPSDPTTGQITTAIGASNPYIVLARITVGTGVTQITNSDITDLRQVMDLNSAWPWRDYTPTWTNFSPANGTLNHAKYAKSRRTVRVRLKFTLGSSSSASGEVKVSLPVASVDYGSIFQALGLGTFWDSSASTYYRLDVVWESTTTVAFVLTNVSAAYGTWNYLNGTTPAAPAEADYIQATFEYEAAA